MSEDLTIDQILRRRAAQTPNAIAIAATRGKPLTYRGLVEQVDYVAHFLANNGLTHKDCVATVLRNGPEMATAFLGVSGGAISAPLNPDYREAEFDLHLSELNAGALIVQSGSCSPAIAVAQKRNIPVIDLTPVLWLAEPDGLQLSPLLGEMMQPTEREYLSQSTQAVQPLCEAEQRQLLIDWNNTYKEDYPTHQPLHQLLEAQAEKTPEAIALLFEDTQFTYCELNLRANQLAHHLIALGVGPEVPVGLCVERSPEMVVALLAILKAGGVYLPLDPEYPRTPSVHARRCSHSGYFDATATTSRFA